MKRASSKQGPADSAAWFESATGRSAQVRESGGSFRLPVGGRKDAQPVRQSKPEGEDHEKKRQKDENPDVPKVRFVPIPAGEWPFRIADHLS